MLQTIYALKEDILQFLGLKSESGFKTRVGYSGARTVDKSSMEAGKTAFWAEENKFTTYGNALRDDYHFVPIAEKPPVRGSPWATNLLLILVEPLLESLRILSQHHLYFKQFQCQFNGATYNASKVPMVNLLLKSLMKFWPAEIFYIVKPNIIF